MFQRKKRKAQIEISFNWIFVLIIGGIILAFFFTIINNQQKRADNEVATELIESLDSVFNTISTNPDTVEEFSIAKADLQFECSIDEDDVMTSEYYIQGVGPVDTTYEALYSPKKLQGTNIISWTQTWRVPFETTVLTYLANENVLFLFVIDDLGSPLKELYDELPEEFSKYHIQKAALRDYDQKGYDRYVIITADGVSAPLALRDKTYIRRITTDFDEVGTIWFSYNQESARTAPYVTKALLWGAIFAEDQNTYMCHTQKVIKRLVLLADIMSIRTEAISQQIQNPQCQSFFDEGVIAYTILASITPATATVANIQTIQEGLEELTNIQKLVIRGSLCPHLY